MNKTLIIIPILIYLVTMLFIAYRVNNNTNSNLFDCYVIHCL